MSLRDEADDDGFSLETYRNTSTHSSLFYSFIQRYLNSPTHQSITRILASFFVLSCCCTSRRADSVTRTIADAFVIDRRPADVICIGINTICGVINRVPHILEEKQMQNLVGDLVQFKKTETRES